MGETMKQTLVEEGSELRGTLASTCPVVVRGSVDGDVDAPAVTIAAGGTVQGRVTTKRLVCEGVVAGQIAADEVVLSGTVRDETAIRARSLEVRLPAEGAAPTVKFGSCRIEVGETGVSTSKGRPRKAPPSVAPPADAE